jgi:murein L,D-transpeptidase YcbB/YkuD
MRRVRFDYLLTGTALALALTANSGASAQSARDLPLDSPMKTANAAESTGSVQGGAGAAAISSAVADKLREMMTSGKFDRVLGGKKDRAPVEAFYSGREFAPLWISDGAMSERGKAVAAYVAGIEADGFDPADYPLPQVKAGADAEALAEAEVKFTDAVLTLVRHAQSGRVHYSRLHSDILYDLAKTDPADVLGKLANASDVAATLDGYNPQQPQYKALKAKLAEVRRGADVEKAVIPSGPVLKYSKDKKGKEEIMSDPRVPALRARFGMKSPEGNTNYDRELSGTIAKFQKEHGLQPSGQLTQATLDVINGPKRDKTVDIIVSNMERWRWVPRELGRTHVVVNIPDYSLRVMRDNQLVWKTRIVVGKPNLVTPLISSDMKFITVNPTWNVPPSIIQNEYLPALQQDPTAMERIGLKVEQNADGTVRIWQPPGDRNALGRIRFNFPNKFLVYQHDTPDKHLFAHERRAYSHGCMRVQDPLKYGEVLLSLVLPNEKYTADRLQKMFGGSEININFPTHIPVHITYQSAFVDDDGKLQIRDDIYGRDRRMLEILKGSERKVADIPMAHPKNTSTAPVRMAPGTFGGGGGLFGGGPSFFDRLFGGSPEPAPKPRARVGSNTNERRNTTTPR